MNISNIDEIRFELSSSSEIALSVSLAVMMFAVALSLKLEHFRFFKENPKVYFTGVISQIIFLPALTVILCYLTNPHPSVALGMILISCCPGGNVSNLLSMFGRANTALSISLTATSSFAAAFITPLSIIFWCGLYSPTQNLLSEITFDKLNFLFNTFLILALPLLIGVSLLYLFPKFAKKIYNSVSLISAICLLLIIVFAFIEYFEVFLQIGISIIVLIIVHNTLAFLLGYISGLTINASKASARSLTFEIGIQNSGLGIVILLTQLDGIGGAGIVAGLWGIWHIIAGLILVCFFRWKDSYV
ncbi:bile acid:sodium symporter [Hellea sp.]|nr:bile acid:sodium symporter [Hellea sp.]